MQSIVLERRRDPDGTSRFVEATLDSDGGLVISGQDIGASVESFFPGARAYEWAETISSRDVPRLVTALGGQPGDDVLSLIAQAYPTLGDSGLTTLLNEHDIPVEVWSSLGD